MCERASRCLPATTGALDSGIWLGSLGATFFTRGASARVVDIVSEILKSICYFSGYYANNDLHNYMLRGLPARPGRARCFNRLTAQAELRLPRESCLREQF